MYKSKKYMKPLLAATYDDNTILSFPVFGTPKVDGIRAIVLEQGVVSRTLKPFNNQFLSEALKSILPIGSDGEIFLNTLRETNGFNSSKNSTLLKGKKKLDESVTVLYYWFDYFKTPESSYLTRIQQIQKFVCDFPKILEPLIFYVGDVICYLKIIPLIPEKFTSLSELSLFENKMIDSGFEGVIVRSGDGHYKYGRSSSKEGLMFKIKRFSDMEGLIIGFKALETNDNPQIKNALGYNKRSTNKDGKKKMDTLGSLTLQIDFNGEQIETSVGSGFTDLERQDFWNNRMELLGKVCKFKYFAYGTKEAPRHGVFLDTRDSIDT